MSRDAKGKKIRRYEPPSPSYCSEDELEREDYFIDNPEFEFDELPQPFRFLDRMVEDVLDRVSEEIEKVEELRECKRNTKPVSIFRNPTLLDCSGIDENSSPLLKPQNDSAYRRGFLQEEIHVSSTINALFMAKGKSIQAISTVSKTCLACTEVDSKNFITLLETFPVTVLESGQSIDAVFAFDDSGCCFSFFFSNKCFIPVKIFDESKNEASKVIKWQFCNDSNLVCITKRQPKNGHFIEVYRMPREQWLNDFQQILGKLENATMKIESDESTGMIEEVAQGSSRVECQQEEEEDDIGSSFLQRSSHSVSIAHATHMILIAVFNPKKETSCGSLQSALKLVETGKIGSGDKHCLSTSFFESLKYQLTNDLTQLGFISDIEDDLQFTHSLPTLHFLQKIDKPTKDGITNSKYCLHDMVGIWWSFQNLFVTYKLPKSSRDGDILMEVAYPNADAIIRSCVNEETSHVAFMLQNGNIVVWDRSLGEPSRIISLESDVPVFMEFCRLSDNTQRLLIGTKSGSMRQINYSSKVLEINSIVDKSLVKQGEILFASLAPCNPSLLFVARQPNYITVFDLNQNSAVFHFELPEGAIIDPYIQQCFKFNESLSLLIVSSRKVEHNDYHLCAIFVFNMHIEESQPRSIPSTDSSPQKLPPDYFNGLESIAVSLMKRIGGQKAERVARQQRRWKEYLGELEKRA